MIGNQSMSQRNTEFVFDPYNFFWPQFYNGIFHHHQGVDDDDWRMELIPSIGLSIEKSCHTSLGVWAWTLYLLAPNQPPIVLTLHWLSVQPFGSLWLAKSHRELHTSACRQRRNDYIKRARERELRVNSHESSSLSSSPSFWEKEKSKGLRSREKRTWLLRNPLSTIRREAIGIYFISRGAHSVSQWHKLSLTLGKQTSRSRRKEAQRFP